jgi:hypothetical protein
MSDWGYELPTRMSVLFLLLAVFLTAVTVLLLASVALVIVFYGLPFPVTLLVFIPAFVAMIVTALAFLLLSFLFY